MSFRIMAHPEDERIDYYASIRRMWTDCYRSKTTIPTFQSPKILPEQLASNQYYHFLQSKYNKIKEEVQSQSAPKPYTAPLNFPKWNRVAVASRDASRIP